MHGITAVLFAGALGTLGLAMGPAAPDPQASIKACHDRCDASASETDRETCKLNCRHAVESKDKPHIIRWKEERSVGGTVPGQDAPPPPKRTVTTVTPRGTTTEVTQGPSTGPKPASTTATRSTTVLPSPRHRYYFGLVDCQDRCNSHKIGVDRARCKLQCFRRHPGPPPPPTVAAPPIRHADAPAAAVTTSPAQPSTPTVDCTAQCASEGSEDDRLTCETNCRNAQRHQTRPTTKIETTTVTTRPADCRRRCQSKATSCRSTCEGDGSDASTCTLQCDQTARSCERRCG